MLLFVFLLLEFVGVNCCATYIILPISATKKERLFVSLLLVSTRIEFSLASSARHDDPRPIIIVTQRSSTVDVSQASLFYDAVAHHEDATIMPRN